MLFSSGVLAEIDALILWNEVSVEYEGVDPVAKTDEYGLDDVAGGDMP